MGIKDEDIYLPEYRKPIRNGATKEKTLLSLHRDCQTVLIFRLSAMALRLHILVMVHCDNGDYSMIAGTSLQEAGSFTFSC